MANDTVGLTVPEIRNRIRSRIGSAAEICRQSLDWIERTDGELRAFLTVEAQYALAAAERVDTQSDSSSEPRPLAGVPIAVKDVFATKGIRTTCGSRVLSSFVPPYSATAVERLEQAGAILIGKTNMDEFAMGSSTENSAFFPTRNPWDLERVPGGSSGGSAAAVAAGHVVAALGSDTGGSVRQPAAFCGVVGLKPTYGRVSRFGLIAFASSLDHVGIFARTVEDCAAVFDVVAGPDTRDSTCSPIPVERCAGQGSLNRIRVGVVSDELVEQMESGSRDVYRANVDLIRSLGATIVSVRMPHWKFALPAYYILATSEASSNLARYDGVRYGHRSQSCGDLREMYRMTREEGFGDEVKRRIILGTYSLSSGYYEAYYVRACKARALVMRDFADCFSQVDLLVMPTTPSPAFRIGEKTSDPIEMYLSDIFTVPANLAGVPALSIPAGFSGGLPVGIQVLGPQFSETRIFQFARGFEEAAALPRRLPSGVVATAQNSRADAR